MNVLFASARGLSWGAGALVAFMAATPISSAFQGPEDPGAAQLFGGLPLSFVENRGQWDTPARFVAKRGPMVAHLEHNALVVELRDSTDPENPKALVLRLAFEGASEDVRLEGEGQQPGVRNYFLGNDPEAWRTGVPGFDSVLYRGIQEGIDLRVRDRDGRLEYDLLLGPGADLGRFTVRCEGAESITVEPDGSLALQTAIGRVRQTPPATWYVLPSGERQPVDCSFVLLSEGRYGFEIPDRDPGLPVVIDPGIEWSTFLGGSDDDQILGLAIDSLGRAIVAGRTRSPDFPGTGGAAIGGNEDGFVACLDMTQTGASQLCWASYLGGSDLDRVLRVVLDDSDDVYLCGQTKSVDFPATTGAFDVGWNGDWDAFTTKLTSSGTGVLYSTFLGGSSLDVAVVLELSGPDTVAMGGTTRSAGGFPTTPGCLDPSLGGGQDNFIAIVHMGSGGTADLVYSTYLGGSSAEEGVSNDLFPSVSRSAMSLAVDEVGDVLATGGTASSDFPVTNDAYSMTKALGFDVYFVHLTPQGGGINDLIYSTFIGGDGTDLAHAIAYEGAGVVVIGGDTTSHNFPVTPGAFDTDYEGQSNDAFVLRLDPGEQGQAQLAYSTFLGGAVPNPDGADENVIDLALDGSSGWILAGGTGAGFPPATENTFPTTCGAYDVSFNGNFDAYIAYLSPAGNGIDDLVYSSFIGGAGTDALLDVAVLTTGPHVEILAVGLTDSADFPTTPDAYQPNLIGPPEGIMVRMELARQWKTYCSTAPNSVGPGALIAGSCNISVADNTFELFATGAIPNQFGLFYYGPEQQQVPFGDGFQCVAPGAIGLFRLNPPQEIDPTGAASRLVDFTQPPADAGPGQITAGSTWNFQFWYRDPAGPGGTTFNLSDALSVTFTP